MSREEAIILFRRVLYTYFKLNEFFVIDLLMVGVGRKGKGHKNTKRRGNRCVQKNKQETKEEGLFDELKLNRPEDDIA